VATAMSGRSVLDTAGRTTSLLTSPLFHVSGCHSGLVVGLLAGVRIVVPVGRFDPVHAMELIERERVTVWATVPTMVWRVVEHPDRHRYDLSSVVSVAYGGSPSAGELQRRVRETFPNVRTVGNAYGLTESSSVATVNTGADIEARPDSVGRPLPVVEVRVVGDDGEGVPTGEVGEIWVRGPIVMPGYWGKPEATAEVLTPDGWLRTGDLGRLDDEGFLYVTDRAKDMIIRGGENVYSVEVENRLVEHPDVLDAAVVGVPHPTLGEEVKAVVQVAEGSPLAADDVRRWVAETLADFKVPAHVRFTTDPLPHNATGKLLKAELRAT
jgi:long-chain acyl-CoA synthetase